MGRLNCFVMSLSKSSVLLVYTSVRCMSKTSTFAIYKWLFIWLIICYFSSKNTEIKVIWNRYVVLIFVGANVVAKVLCNLVEWTKLFFKKPKKKSCWEFWLSLFLSLLWKCQFLVLTPTAPFQAPLVSKCLIPKMNVQIKKINLFTWLSRRDLILSSIGSRAVNFIQSRIRVSLRKHLETTGIFFLLLIWQ